MQRISSLEKTWLIGKDPDAWKDGGQEKKEATENEMVGWLNGHERDAWMDIELAP